MNSEKIFCIGFQKTGTSSMGRALETLGYRVCGSVGLKLLKLDDEIRPLAFGVVPKYDAFQDNPWPILFRDLDLQWPNSRFILTVRDEQSWIKSVVRHFGLDSHPMQQWIYGVGFPSGNEQVFLDRYRKHNQDVLRYFHDRPGDLLVVKIEDGDLWAPLCRFLSIDIPNEPFPHSNKGGQGWKAMRRIRNIGKRIVRKIPSAD